MNAHSYLAALLVAVGCGSGTAPAGPQPTGGEGGQTGLEGVARRGPTRPVCQTGVSCDAPFRASFEVRQTGQVLARFESDSTGHFLVYLAPGSYTVVPDASAPLLSRGQAQEVTVGSTGLTHVELKYDTGIR